MHCQTRNPANTRRWTSAGLMLDQRRRRCASIGQKIGSTYRVCWECWQATLCFAHRSKQKNKFCLIQNLSCLLIWKSCTNTWKIKVSHMKFHGALCWDQCFLSYTLHHSALLSPKESLENWLYFCNGLYRPGWQGLSWGSILARQNFFPVGPNFSEENS